LSAILLAGLGLNALLGWWWADPVAAFGIVCVAACEGWRTGRPRRSTTAAEAADARSHRLPACFTVIMRTIIIPISRMPEA
jgi:divalent metal cation (Fe/Co/Zn/Cd) transporter